jgi:hypothetical protein
MWNKTVSVEGVVKMEHKRKEMRRNDEEHGI